MAEVGIEGLQVVLAGSFNPKIFHPSWFVHHDLVSTAEGEAAEGLTIVHPEIASFKLESWQLQVQQQRFTLATHHPHDWVTLRDVALGTFRLLSHTPISHVGINLNTHYNPGVDLITPDKLTERLIHEDKWAALGDAPGVASVSVHFRSPSDRADLLQIKIEPSARVPKGLYVNVHEQFVSANESSALDALEILEEECDASLKRAQEMREKALKLCRP